MDNKLSLIIGAIIFISLFSFFWCLLYSFRPGFVVETECGRIIEPRTPNVAKCVFGSLTISLCILISIWMYGSSY